MAYTPIIAPTDLYTQMYPEVQALISRGDNTIPTLAINSAISEVKMYLSKYDLVQLFGSVALNQAATFQDEFLNDLVKKVAVWNFLRLSNANVDMALALTHYEKAMDALKGIQKGFAMPDGWPYLTTPPANIPEGDAIEWTARKRSRNYW